MKMFPRMAMVLLLGAAAGAAGCSDDSTDPAGGGEADAGGNRDTGGGGTTDTGGGGDDTGTTDTGGGGDDTGTTDTGGGGDDTGGSVTCGEDVFYSGQVFGTDVPNGGAPVFVTDRADFGYADGNLDEVIAAFPGSDAEEPVDVDIMVGPVTVVATNFYTADFEVPPSQSTFWVADANGTVEVRLDFSSVDNVAPFELRVGHQISFRVTALDQFFGNGQVAAATDWSLNEDSPTDNEVYILERGADAPLTVDDIGEMVRLTGTLTGDQGGCGGDANCWDLDYGADDPVTYRTESTFTELGDCLTFVGPLGSFSGAPQVNIINFDWVFTLD